MEETEIDRRDRRTLDAALADDHVSVHADSGSIDIATADEDAVRLNAPGARCGLDAMRWRGPGAMPSLALGLSATQSPGLGATRVCGFAVSARRGIAVSISCTTTVVSRPPIARPANASAIVRAQLIS